MMVDTKKVTAIIFCVRIKEKELIKMGRPKGGKNNYHTKEKN
jgi:hypothetical protein